jgi:hypothetical protein
MHDPASWPDGPRLEPPRQIRLALAEQLEAADDPGNAAEKPAGRASYSMIHNAKSAPARSSATG